MNEAMTLSVIIPVYDEHATILELLRRVAHHPEVYEMVIVDDCSGDGTAELLRQQDSENWPALQVDAPRDLPRIVFLQHEINQGKGSSLRTGFAAATGDIFLTQDADLEYDPQDYEKLLLPLYDGRADAVYGSRFAGYPRRVHMFWHTVGNRLLTLLSNMLCNLNLTDMETGYKAMRRELVENMVLRSRRFGIEPEITAKLARLRARIYEVPISYSGRSYSEGKKIGWKDAVSAVYTMFRCALVDDREASDPLHATLRRMAVLDRYNAFLFELIAPYVGQRVLEVGAGTGTITQFLRGRDRVCATEFDSQYLQLLERRFEHDPQIRARMFDLDKPVPTDVAAERYDTVICLNVLEHIEDDGAALRRMCEVLEDDGRLVLLVPAHQFLFGAMDSAIGHFRRYARPSLRALLEREGFSLENDFMLNALSTPGWFLNGRILRRTSVPGMQARLANRLVPLFRLERKLNLPIGLSVVAIARRRDPAVPVGSAA
ncbi:MAG: glycosyltransferase [Candidatus Binatia bacterium]|nr:glycosyltransferase [Candidatus Binatia bacterium]MDG2011627.1 glycosyltransferase [Candidatus Binatia bacterium]